MGPVTRQPNKPGLLTLTIKDKSALYLAYMPFVKNGGLFIPTSSNYRLGDEVFMLLNMMGEDEKLPVAGRVIWMTPKGAQGKRTAGIGVQFSEQDRGADAAQDRVLPCGRARRRQADPHDVAPLRAVRQPDGFSASARSVVAMPPRSTCASKSRSFRR